MEAGLLLRSVSDIQGEHLEQDDSEELLLHKGANITHCKVDVNHKQYLS